MRENIIKFLLCENKFDWSVDNLAFIYLYLAVFFIFCIFAGHYVSFNYFRILMTIFLG